VRALAVNVVAVVLGMGGCSDRRELSPLCEEDCAARIHPRGILDERSDDFHGAELARRDWDFALCASCHGEDFGGGSSGADCIGCHAEGPTACVTCHRDGPTTGAHAEHAAAQLACAECHVVPSTWDAPGHIVGDPAPAEITFGARAQLTPVAADRQAPATFSDGACANVYCHGDTLHAGGAAPQPRWDVLLTTGCASCHGAPPPSHAQAMCATCHPAGAPHIDGVTQIGRTGGCDGCHGSAASPAPPVDLAGNTVTTALGVGAHQAHLLAPAGVSAPIACGSCHVVPSTVDAAGHLDSLAPAEVTAGLGWDRATGTCATAWCHGPARPAWTTTVGAACGTCHGLPPATASHTPGMPLTSCVGCHPQSVTSTGSIVITAGPSGATSTHLDGDVDAQ
jgi:predicted CxxxxCH...CXXCH cytochrome family protein